ncbi:hypothetical protein ATI61_107395 [Archangium gephyra]|uniref:Outer membrane protein beta-barrel domain-containing protein n=1 Tax=Archangium gephyra TaxID=48 RepID=A0AAC8QHU6_9BACT|nr:hypothetical protein [Archangium gephyra]AKJ07953.1 Hypothetical protein AA314_09579 [Archangium gephyra]REG29699.1 hypothetical protein ATI61_107395 [Archangium gephyra]
MKLKILAGLVTALIYGNAAMAQDVSDTDTNNTQGQTSPDNIGGAGQDDTLILDQEDVAPVPDIGLQEEGVGGAGLEGQDAFGGSGQAGQTVQPKSGIPMQGQNGMTLFCTPVQQGQATGGSGDLQGNEQSSLQRDYDVQVGQVDDTIVSDDAFGGSGYDVKEKDEGQEKGDMRGLSVLVGAGVEGYTGGLAPEINPGATVGVMAGLRPSKVFGLELGYSGAVNNLDADVGGSGPDIVRNGAVANVTLGLTAAPIQPYVLGGFGMNWYNIRNGEALGFSDDTSSRVPVGVGLRTHIGDFTADARVNYNILLNEDFAPGVDDRFSTGSYQGTLNLGGTF